MSTHVSTARWTGIFYLGLAISGMLGFLLIRNQLYVPDDALATLANLEDRGSLARLGVAAEVATLEADAGDRALLRDVADTMEDLRAPW